MTFPRLDAATALAPHARPETTAAAGEDADLRRVAAEFEALLLAQLTSALNPKDEDEEGGGVFGGGGMNLYRQMFSEQIAQTMAKSGGVGIGDLVLTQMRAGRHEKADGAGVMRSAIETSRMLRRAETKAGERSASATAKGIQPELRPASTDPSKDIFLVSEASMAAASPTQFEESRVAVRPRRVNPLKAAGEITGASGVASPGSSEQVILQMPVSGRISSNFGVRRDPIHGRHRHHRGVDIAAPRGTPIEAAADGTVVFAGWRRGYGNTVTIEHADGRRTRYAHADKLLVTRGDVVEAGQSIAKVGSTGRSTGPHLHFEVFEGKSRVDPLKALAQDLTLARR